MGRFNRKVANQRLKKLVEAAGAGMARVYKHISEGPFAIVSASRGTLSEEENAARTEELKATFGQYAGGGFIPAAGVWEGVPEDSIILPGVSREVALAVAQQYDQDAVIWGDQGQFYLLDKTGQVLDQGPVSEYFHYLGKGDEAEEPEGVPGFTELPKGQRFQLRAPQASVWQYDGVPVQPEKVRGGLAVKDKFAFSLGPKPDLTADGVPFFFILEADGPGLPKFGFAVHEEGLPSDPHLRVVTECKGHVWKLPKTWLAAYLPLKRVV
jgi:hypothetical protein